MDKTKTLLAWEHKVYTVEKWEKKSCDLMSLGSLWVMIWGFFSRSSGSSAK